MIITNSAKKILQEALTSSNNDCFRIKLQNSCCGTSLFLQMSKLSVGDEQAVRVNDIPLIMDQEVVKRTSNVTIDANDGQLIIVDPNASGCC